MRGGALRAPYAAAGTCSAPALLPPGTFGEVPRPEGDAHEAQLKSAVAARRRFRWRAQIDEVIELVAGGSHFPLEFRYDRDVARAHGLPAAAKQARFAKPDGTKGFRDRCYEKYGLIVELDGREFHPAEQRGRDQLRDNEAAATTGATLRYTWADVDRAPCETAGQVYRALRLRGYLGPVRPCSAACRALAASRPNASRLNHQAGVLPR
jgi:hypothetical protein